MFRLALWSLLLMTWASAALAQHPGSVSYEGTTGLGRGKHVVFVANDHEYRGEEACPALARMLAQHLGFRCTVVFGVNAEGELQPGTGKVTGLDVLKTADLVVLALRFQNFADEEMQHFVDYIDAGKPVIGLRTSTHAFQIPKDRKFAKYSRDYAGEDYSKGFGRQVLGETWVNHYGPNQTTSAKLLIEESQASHPVLRGVKNVWLRSGVYLVNPDPQETTVLAKSQVLQGMSPDGQPDAQRNQLQSSVWVRTLPAANGGQQRVFTTTHGASTDLLDDGFRRLLVNACLWCMGLEAAITPDLNIAFVGPYQPSNFAFNGAKLKVKPADLAGWDSPILGGEQPAPRGGRGGARGAAAP